MVDRGRIKVLVRRKVPELESEAAMATGWSSVWVKQEGFGVF